MAPTVTVVLCTYQQANYLPCAIDSVLAQTYQDWQLLIIDNGSTDGSDKIILAQTDPRIDYTLYRDNGKVTVRLNQAIRQARGEFISILYADDYYLPMKLARQVRMMVGLPDDYGVVYGPGYRERGTRRTLDPSLRQDGWVLKRMLDLHFTEGFINPISPLIRKACFERDPFNETVGHGMEAWFMQAALSWRFQYQHDPFVVMRDHPNTEGKQLKRNREMAGVWFRALLDDGRFPDDCRTAALRFWAQFLSVCGWCSLRELADPLWARACFEDALWTSARQIFNPKVLLGLALTLLPTRDLHTINDFLDARTA